ncbi:hypothetical protein MKY69_04010 [Streptococcus sp. FSL R7-0212]|uniref:hypothetical protein n=1 Tax=Streptococcus sp. FSL R7-0212 TaxID=2921726 RepID=UPI0030F79611
MEARRHNRFSDDMKKSIDYKNVFSVLTSIIGFILYRIFKLFMFVIFSPFYLLIFLKNWVVIGIMTTVTYAIIAFLYYNNTGKILVDGFSSPILWTDTRITILLIVSAILALIATIGQFSDK